MITKKNKSKNAYPRLRTFRRKIWCVLSFQAIYMILFVHKKWYRLEICTVFCECGKKLERPQRKNCHTLHSLDKYTFKSRFFVVLLFLLEYTCDYNAKSPTINMFYFNVCNMEDRPLHKRGELKKMNI